MKKKSLFAGFLALVMSVSMMSFTAFATESTEPVADATAKTVTVSNEDQFMSISAYSNSDADSKVYPRTFSGWTVIIADDLDMTGYTWQPLVNFNGSMTGKTDSRGSATISHVTVSVPEKAGLCANSANGTFSYLTIANSSFVTTQSGQDIGNYAGAFAANGFTSKFEYCHVVDTIVTGNRFVGGITGYCYGNITGCTVKAVNGETIISAALNGNSSLIFNSRRKCGDNAGGIVGFMGEGNMKVTGCTVDGITVQGTRQVAGIAGIALYGNTVSGNFVYNTTIRATLATDNLAIQTTASVGGVVGQIQPSTDTVITITGNTVGEDTTIARTNGSTKYCGWLLGDAERATDANQYDVTGNYCEITTSLPIVGN